ncbi:hypothetical protein [Methylomonas paludis]|nr:hypothetical protein [Methylomonas paludis]
MIVADKGGVVSQIFIVSGQREKNSYHARFLEAVRGCAYRDGRLN